MPHLIDYQGIPLLVQEFVSLRALEHNLGRVIRVITNNYQSVGFKAEDHHIIAITIVNRRLRELPEEFTLFSKLQTFTSINSRLKSLPESFGNLKSLQKLHLSNTQLTSLPESFGQLTNLKKLRLHKSYLRALPETFENLRNLEVLCLSRNKLRALPESFGDLINLKELDLHKNQLTSLPESLTNLKSLQSLNLRGNRLMTLPKKIGTLNLNYLELSENDFFPTPTLVFSLLQLLAQSYPINFQTVRLTNILQNLGDINPYIFSFVAQHQARLSETALAKLFGLVNEDILSTSDLEPFTPLFLSILLSSSLAPLILQVKRFLKILTKI